MKTTPIIEVKDLSLFYGDFLAFKNINLTLEKGNVSGIVGPSGCGKSSFLHCLNRMIELIPGTRISGDILFNGVSIFNEKINPLKFRRQIGIVFQEPTVLPISIRSNLRLPLKEHGFNNISERIQKALVDVGLWNEVKDKLDTPANHLSGGQKQRLCLARSLALEPEIILMDEPCSALDPISTEKIEDLIHKLKGDYTIAIITHNLAQAKRLCDELNVFWPDSIKNSGTLIESGTCFNIFENPKNSLVKDYISGIRG